MERARLLGTGLPAGSISSTRSTELTEGWMLIATPPGVCSTPRGLGDLHGWQPAAVPGTVALSIGPEDLDRHPNYDASDWWYRCSLPRTSFTKADRARYALRFDGLATLAEVWFNGERVLESSNMFCTHQVDVTDLVTDDNELAIRFRSLDALVAERRPRPRWKTKLVDEQQLRWFRTTLLGRIPGWTPAVRPVGPWRSIWVEAAASDLVSLDVRTAVDAGQGIVRVRAEMIAAEVRGAAVRVGGQPFELATRRDGTSWTLTGVARVAHPVLWWPATHGDPTLHSCALEITTSAGVTSVDCGRVGFRDLRVDQSGDRTRFVVNGVPVFCRGSCWTTNDIVSLVGDPARMRNTLALLADAHGNMVRVGGTMVYENDAFYEACDELGILVWQDFMFANMDYPMDDPAFAAQVRAEVDQQLRRLSRHPSVAAFCGGSEVEQQAAMFGAPREIWSNSFVTQALPALVEEHAPGTPYWPSTPTGGSLPFHVGHGLAHYYGVGAYRRPLEDVRVAGVRFTPECLGFSHVPEPDNLRKLTQAGAVPPHHPAWKAGVPRDTGPGWDFEDVRDHYLERLYGHDPVSLRSEDLDRYLALSRAVTGEVMGWVFSEWRREDDPCGGALTWFLNDLRPGAGWGLIDSDGLPKAAYHHLRRSWAPRCVRLLDRGLDGLSALIINERADPLEAKLEILVITRGSTVAAEATRNIDLPGRSSTEVSVEEVLGHFLDSTYSYRFGPPRHEAVVARLVVEREGAVLSEDVYRPIRTMMTPVKNLTSMVHLTADGGAVVTLATEVMLYDVRVAVRDHRPLENHFCLTPGRPRSVLLQRTSDSGRSFQGYVEASNLADSVRLPVPG